MQNGIVLLKTAGNSLRLTCQWWRHRPLGKIFFICNLPVIYWVRRKECLTKIDPYIKTDWMRCSARQIIAWLPRFNFLLASLTMLSIIRSWTNTGPRWGQLGTWGSKRATNEVTVGSFHYWDNPTNPNISLIKLLMIKYWFLVLLSFSLTLMGVTTTPEVSWKEEVVKTDKNLNDRTWFCCLFQTSCQYTIQW